MATTTVRPEHNRNGEDQREPELVPEHFGGVALVSILAFVVTVLIVPTGPMGIRGTAVTRVIAVALVVFVALVIFGSAVEPYCLLLRSAIRAFISAISLRWASMIPSASFRTRGSKMWARSLVRIAIEWCGIMAFM